MRIVGIFLALSGDNDQMKKNLSLDRTTTSTAWLKKSRQTLAITPRRILFLGPNEILSGCELCDIWWRVWNILSSSWRVILMQNGCHWLSEVVTRLGGLIFTPNLRERLHVLRVGWCIKRMLFWWTFAVHSCQSVYQLANVLWRPHETSLQHSPPA